MRQNGDAAIGAGQAFREVDDPAELRHEQGRRSLFLLVDVAPHRLRVAAVAEAIVGHGDQAVAGQRGGERLHELLRAGEAVGDHHHRGGPGVLGPEDGDRRFPCKGVCDREASRGAFEAPEPRSNAHQRDRNGEDTEKFHSFSGVKRERDRRS